MSARRPLLRPLVPVYAAALMLQRGARHLLRQHPRSLGGAVISVGSISAGGAGKTPFVLLLAAMLQRRDYAVSILTRGYGRSDSTVERVDARDPSQSDGDDGPARSADRYGDEPLLLARRSSAPVYVGADRYRAGLLAEAELPTGKTLVHLLDDGFQHQRLARDIDIVLLTREDLGDTLLPAGNLREPRPALRRAHILVLRDDEADALEPHLNALTRTPAAGASPNTPLDVSPDIPRFSTAYTAPHTSRDTPPEAPAVPSQGRSAPASADRPAPLLWRIRRSLRFPPEPPRAAAGRPFVFCGIARPEDFVAMLRADGLDPVGTLTFADHHRYTARDLERVVAAARSTSAASVITTEKDAVKLTPAMRRRLEQVGPLLVPELHVDLLREREAMEQLVRLVARLDRRHRR